MQILCGRLPSTKFATDAPKSTGTMRRHAITDAALAHFQAAYPNEKISKQDIFYYIYGLLHSEDYKSRYADNLTKELPRIPCVKKAADFLAFSQAGRDLAGFVTKSRTLPLGNVLLPFCCGNILLPLSA